VEDGASWLQLWHLLTHVRYALFGDFTRRRMAVTDVSGERQWSFGFDKSWNITSNAKGVLAWWGLGTVLEKIYWSVVSTDDFNFMTFRFQGAVLLKIQVFWDVTPCRPVNSYQGLDCLTLRIKVLWSFEMSVTVCQ